MCACDNCGVDAAAFVTSPSTPCGTDVLSVAPVLLSAVCVRATIVVWTQPLYLTSPSTPCGTHVLSVAPVLLSAVCVRATIVVWMQPFLSQALALPAVRMF